MIRRTVTLAAATLLALGMIAGPAAAHHLTVDPPGAGSGPSAGPFEPGGWVGGPAPLPGQGKGLVLGGMSGQDPMTPAHVGGLNTACEALRENGNGVVDIFGPPPTEHSGCPHGQ